MTKSGLCVATNPKSCSAPAAPPVSKALCCGYLAIVDCTAPITARQDPAVTQA